MCEQNYYYIYDVDVNVKKCLTIDCTDYMPLYIKCHCIRISLSKPHSSVENDAVIHAQRTTVKNGIATHYCSLVWWFMYKQTQ